MVTIEVSGRYPPPPSAVRKIVLAEAEAATRQAVLVVDAAWKKEAAPSRRTGTYLRSIFTSVSRAGNTIYGTVGTNLGYAKWLEYGTGIYGPARRLIRPVRAKALRFPQPGNRAFTLAGRQRSGRAGQGAAWVYAAYVRGIRPRRYATEAFRGSTPKVTAIFRAAGHRAAEKIRAL